MARTMTAPADHTCHGAVFCGTAPDRARAECGPCAAADAAAALQATDPAELLTRAYELTHQMHAWQETARRAENYHERADELRAMRDLITAELVRRAS